MLDPAGDLMEVGEVSNKEQAMNGQSQTVYL